MKQVALAVPAYDDKYCFSPNEVAHLLGGKKVTNYIQDFGITLRRIVETRGVDQGDLLVIQHERSRVFDLVRTGRETIADP